MDVQTKTRSLLGHLSHLWHDVLFSSKAKRPKANKIICNMMLVSIILCCVQATWQALSSGTLMSGLSYGVYEYGVYTVVNIVLIELTTIGMLMLVHYDRKAQFTMARYVCRVLVVLLIASLLSCFLINGLIAVELFYIFQFICVVSYQVVNDPNLSKDVPWVNPFSRKARKDESLVEALSREKYIPLNFFNLFWVFILASIAGIILEEWYHLMLFGEWQDRAGLMWGPFSPIYGFGGTLMTIALNRFWNRNPIMIFLVSGIIGASFEFFTSWYLEVAFGIMAWDYSGTFLNIDGRTNFAFFCAWGMCGLVWIKFLLPYTMKLVDAVKPQWRAALTVVMFVFMVTNACVTILALDCWSQRTAGHPPQDELQVFFAENFGDDMMENRFESMTVTQEGSVRTKIDGSS